MDSVFVLGPEIYKLKYKRTKKFFSEKKQVLLAEKRRRPTWWRKLGWYKKSPHPCCLSWGRMASVSFVSFEKYELLMRKNFSKFFHFFCPNSEVGEKFWRIFFSKNVAFESLVYYTKPWTLYLVSVLRNSGWKKKYSLNLRFFNISFKKKQKKHEAEFFFEIFFQRKCSLGTCSTFSENMVSVSVLGFEKFASQVWKIGTCHEICEKNVTTWAFRKARAPKTACKRTSEENTKKSWNCAKSHCMTSRSDNDSRSSLLKLYLKLARKRNWVKKGAFCHMRYRNPEICRLLKPINGALWYSQLVRWQTTCWTHYHGLRCYNYVVLIVLYLDFML